jgi:hypothetical protein
MDVGDKSFKGEMVMQTETVKEQAHRLLDNLPAIPGKM